MQRIVLASGNPGKLREFRALFADLDTELVPQAELGIDDPEEPGPGFIENALAKARHASGLAGLPALADDSGLCVPALGGVPGLHSARYAGRHGDHAANNAKLLQAMASLDAARRNAFFICVLALVQAADDPAPLVAEGRWDGRILLQASGAGGFGYDPLFQPTGFEASAAELAPEVKNRLSHRGRAMQELRRRLAPATTP